MAHEGASTLSHARAIREFAYSLKVERKLSQAMIPDAEAFECYPILTALPSRLPEVHRLYGMISRITIIITEQRTVNDPEEVKRREALAGGMVPDLGSHAVMILQHLMPI